MSAMCLQQREASNALVLETSDTVDNLLRRLTTIEVARDLSVGLLTLVTTS